MALAHLLHALAPAHLRGELMRIRAKWWRRLRRVEQRVVTLEPAGPVRGEVLFAYVIDPFLRRAGVSVEHSHTHFWESLTMAETFRAAGFRVDVISWKNLGFTPQRRYDVAVDVRLLLERWVPFLPATTVKVFHAETAHPSFYNPAQRRRLADLKARRGFLIRPQKLIEENRAAEVADVITIIGNEQTQATYAFAGKPQVRIPISTPFTYPGPEGKDFAAARRRFLWFGSGGLVHKGLDLVLDAFAGMPDYHLTVCGPVRRERDFERAYFRELYQTPNIHAWGWIDVGSPAFLELARRTLGLVYPSCSEGTSGSAITCMHAGLVPVLSREAGVEPAGGVLLESSSVEQIRTAVAALSEESPRQLEERARTAWSFARAHHTKETFSAAYRGFVERLVAGEWRRRDDDA